MLTPDFATLHPGYISPRGSQLHQLHPELAPHDPRGALQPFDGGAAVVGIEQQMRVLFRHNPRSVQNAFGSKRSPHGAQRNAGFLPQCWPRISLRSIRATSLLFLHLAGELTRNHRLDRRGGDFLAEILFVEPAFEARPRVDVLLFCHDCASGRLNSKCLWQARLPQDAVRRVAACNAERNRKVSLCNRAIPDFVTALALADQRAACRPKQLSQCAVELGRHSGGQRFCFA